MWLHSSYELPHCPVALAWNVIIYCNGFQCDLETSGVLETLPEGQNYFHNHTLKLFAFSTFILSGG